jgi:hypothetical protein
MNERGYEQEKAKKTGPHPGFNAEYTRACAAPVFHGVFPPIEFSSVAEQYTAYADSLGSRRESIANGHFDVNGLWFDMPLGPDLPQKLSRTKIPGRGAAHPEVIQIS